MGMKTSFMACGTWRRKEFKDWFEQETGCVHLSWLKESPEDRSSLWRAFPTLWYSELAVNLS